MTTNTHCVNVSTHIPSLNLILQLYQLLHGMSVAQPVSVHADFLPVDDGEKVRRTSS